MRGLPERLCALNAVFSWESEVRAFLLTEVEPRAGRLRVDAPGNLITWKKGREHAGSKLLLAAHMGEAGLMTRQTIDDGYLKFDTVGAINRRVLLGKPVPVGPKWVPEVVGLKAYHLVSREEEKSVPKLDEFYIDIGARDRTGAEAQVALGDTAAFDSDVGDFGAGLLHEKALRSRLGCVVLFTLLWDELPMNCIFVFITQKEVGACGIFGAALPATPEVALVVDGADAADLTGVPAHKQGYSLGGGVVLSYMSQGVIVDRGLFEALRSLAEAGGILWQTMRSVVGRTDTTAIQRTKEEVRTAVVSTPVRYPRTPSGVTCLRDVEAALALIQVFIGYSAEKERIDMKLIEILQALDACHGPSGSEGATVGVLRTLAVLYMDFCTTDVLGNLIYHKKGIWPKVLFAAHADSIGLMATYIDKKGFFRSGPVGGLFAHEVLGTFVRSANGTRGVVALEGKVELKDMKLEHLYLDIGARNEVEARTMVQVGDIAAYDMSIFCSGRHISSPYLDDRIACVVLLMVVERLENTENDPYLVLTVQEEVGLRGARTVTYEVTLDYDIAVDVTDSDNIPSALHVRSSMAGEGAVIKVINSSVIYHPSVAIRLKELALMGNIPRQKNILCFGGTDAGATHQSRVGVYTGGISTPICYVHTPLEVADLGDVEACAALVVTFAQAKLIC